jgi:hypothetical protein
MAIGMEGRNAGKGGLDPRGILACGVDDQFEMLEILRLFERDGEIARDMDEHERSSVGQ